MGGLVFLTAMSGLLIFFSILVALIALATYVIKAVSFFMMGQKAGVPNSWLAFIPWVQEYVPMVLPHRDYELLFVKPKKRIAAFWILLIAQIISGIITSVQSGISNFGNQITAGINPDEILPGREGILTTVTIIFAVLSILVGILAWLFVLIIALLKMRMNLDLFRTYGMEGGAMAISIIGIFLPIVPLFGYLVLIGKEPEYGYGNYAQEFAEVPYAEDVQEDYYY